MIELILLERVEKLGQMGQRVKVRPGYARNYLLPQKKALRATEANLAYFEAQRAQLEANNLARKQDAEAVAGKLEGLHVVLIRQAGESGQLYGSVSARDIADAVTAAGFTVDRQQIVLDHPIKTLGLRDASPGGRGRGRRQCRAIGRGGGTAGSRAQSSCRAERRRAGGVRRKRRTGRAAITATTTGRGGVI